MITCNRRDVLRMLSASAAWLAQGQGSIQLTPLSSRLSVLSGAGGNITILTSSDGLLMTDAGLPDTVAAVLGKLKHLSTLPVQHLINTHWHYDHVGANAELAKAGAKILAHVNTARRLSETQKIAFYNREIPALPVEGRPKQTFRDKGKLSFGGHEVRYEYLPPAHTDGDTTIHFVADNVYVAGDLFFNGSFPFIDYSSGGSIEGMAQNAELIGKVVDDKTKTVPGHGPVASKADLKDFADMLSDANERISKLVKSTRTPEEIVAAEPLKKYDAKWGQGPMKTADWIRMLNHGKCMKR